MKTHFKNNGSKSLIVFFCGWAMDEKPFEILESADSDVLFVFDYSTLDLNFNFSKYDKKVLIAFSYGVFIAAIADLPDFDYKIAINGTLKPIDKEFGIVPKIFDLTLQSIDEDSMLKFYSRMFDNNLDDEYFKEHLPQRNSSDCKIELAQIKKYYEENPDKNYKYDKVIISDKDKIILAKNQLNYWQGADIKRVDASHFIFYKFNNFDEIINL